MYDLKCHSCSNHEHKINGNGIMVDHCNICEGIKIPCSDYKRKPQWGIHPFFRWYDLWVGVFIDTKNHAAYIIPVPMLGIKITW